MKIVNITGGLGNQMFQYAFALALKNKYPQQKVLIDTQHYRTVFFKRFKGVNLHNGFEISKIFPNASLPIASPKDLMKLTYWVPNYVLSRLVRRFLPQRSHEYVAPYRLNYSYDNAAFDNPDSCYYEGYWQCIKYLKDIKPILRSAFAHPAPNVYNARLITEIQSCNSVGLHIRRGDYLNEPEFKGICDIEYYSKAIAEIVKRNDNCVFYIFSNDMQWCRESILPLLGNSKVVFVTENKGHDSCWDMFLMSYCKNLIIANSSFSWWSAFLSDKVKYVCAPFPWLNRDCTIDLYDDSWILI